MHPHGALLLASLLFAAGAFAGPPAHDGGEDVEDTPLTPGVAPAPRSGRTWRAADFSSLDSARLSGFLKQQQGLARLQSKDPETAEKLREIVQGAREGGGEWEASVRQPALGATLRKAIGGDPVEYFRLHALVAVAYDQYVAKQELAALDRAPARAELARAQVKAESRSGSGEQKQQGRMLVAQAQVAREKLEALLIPGFPRAVLEAVSRHERDLQKAFEEVEEEDGIAPTGAGEP